MKIIFDATFGEVWVESLRSFFRTHREPRPRFLHLHDLFERGIKDDEWIPELVKQECIVITGDEGRKQPRLPEICRRHKKTHVILSPMLQQANGFQKARAIVCVWPDIVLAASHPKGSRFQIQMEGVHERFKFVHKQA